MRARGMMRASIALLVSFSFLVACGEGESTPSEITTIKITDSGVTDYWIIRSDMAEEDETRAAVNLRNAISDATGAEPGITTDWEKNPIYEHELVIGETLREELLSEPIDRIALGETGYLIRELDGRVYIAGGSAAGTALGVDAFMQQFVRAGQDVEIPAGFEQLSYHEYEMTLYIAGTQLSDEWKIVIANANNRSKARAAERLQAALYEKCGVFLEIVEGAAREKSFVLSDQLPEQDGVHSMRIEKNCFLFESSATAGVSECVERFIERYLDQQYGKFNFPEDFRFLELGDYIIVKKPKSLKG